MEPLPDPPLPFGLPRAGVLGLGDRATAFSFDHAAPIALLSGAIVAVALSLLPSQTLTTAVLWGSYLGTSVYGQYRKTPVRWRGAWALLPGLATAAAASIEGWPWFVAAFCWVAVAVMCSAFLSRAGVYRRDWEARAAQRSSTR
jgi:hypothetical protein